MRIALATLHYKNLDDTLALLTSLSKATIPEKHEVKIYVVDNENSKDLKAELDKNFPGVNLLVSPSNLGFAAGNNLGLKRAINDGAEILIAINNDTIVGKNFFKEILESPIKEESVGAVGGLIYFAPGFEFAKNYTQSDLGRVVWYAGGNFDWNNILGSNAHVDEVDHGQFKKQEDTDFVTGALLITKAKVLKKVGLFDEKYFMYLEDVDLSHRMKLAGYRLIFDPKIKMWHEVGQSSGIGSPLNDYFITRNRLYFGFKFAKYKTKFALFREALRKIFSGTPAQKKAIKDFFMGKLGKGSYL
jgi:hypothetical protein